MLHLRSWLSQIRRRLQFRSSGTRPRLRRTAVRSVIPAVCESLEMRRLLSAAAVSPDAASAPGAALNGSTLQIDGTNADDTINVSLSNPTTLTVSLNGVLSNFQLAQVTDIAIDGLDGNDTLTIMSSVTLPATITGGLGNDRITAGGGDATLTGGAGNDTYVFGNSSADVTQTIVELAGEGTDSLVFSSMTDAVTVDLTSDTALATMTKRTIQTGGAGQAANIENVYGGSGDDSITGNAANNTLIGGGGNDTLRGGDGNDTLRGDGGNDTLDGGDGNDVYSFVTNSELGSDSVTDSSGTDYLYFVGSTNDVTVDLSLTTAQVVNANLGLTLNSATSIEGIYGGSGNDTLTGNSLNNILFGNGGNDTLIGGGGNDMLYGNAGDDILTGDDGNDALYGGDGNDTLTGGLGNDIYVFVNATSSETDTVIEQANEGSDWLNFVAMTDDVTANLNSDTSLAAMNNRTIKTGSTGQAANFENIYSGSGSDVLTGNSANNGLYGNGGNDQIQGGDGNDVLSGGDGSDTLIGGAGNDSYVFANAQAAQTDTISESPGQGTDTVSFTGVTTDVTVDLTSDTSLATMTNRIVQTGGSGQSANFENIYGGSGNDTLTGNSSANAIYGFDGNDTINAGGGNDTLVGGNGNDTLKGGDGNDTYLFANATSTETDTVEELSNAGNDTLNFTPSTDAVTIDLNSDTTLATMTNRTVQTNVAGQATNFENAYGGSGNDTLIGNSAANQLVGGAGNDALSGGAGDDILNAGTGSNILIGGTGRDWLTGGNADDLMLAASYQFEQDTAALAALMSEWASANTYADRLAHLQGTLAGGANGTHLLTSATVTDDSVRDTMTGGTGQDWFIGTSLTADTVTDQGVDETFTQIGSLP